MVRSAIRTLHTKREKIWLPQAGEGDFGSRLHRLAHPIHKAGRMQHAAYIKARETASKTQKAPLNASGASKTEIQ